MPSLDVDTAEGRRQAMLEMFDAEGCAEEDEDSNRGTFGVVSQEGSPADARRALMMSALGVEQAEASRDTEQLARLQAEVKAMAENVARLGAR